MPKAKAKKTTKKKTTKKNQGGRPTRYRKEFDEQARKLCLMGWIDKQLAEFFGIRESTLNNWKKRYPSFMESLKAGKEVADAEVTSALFERAVGYEHDTVAIVKNTEKGKPPFIVPITKKYPPDPLSMKYWLNNRQPERWREKVDHTSSDGSMTPQTHITYEVLDPDAGENS